MDNLLLLPEWLGTAVIGAVIAVLGYVAKLVIESWRTIRESQDARRAGLVELQSLLRAAWVGFSVQNEHAKRLLAMIRERNPGLVDPAAGYDRSFARAYAGFTPEEKELHSIIRAITMHSLRPTNKSLLEWLQRDAYFKARTKSRGILGQLAGKLAHLEAHLILWHAKYEAWIPDVPEHALVYMADEEEHGLGFPGGIDEIVRKALE